MTQTPWENAPHQITCIVQLAFRHIFTLTLYQSASLVSAIMSCLIQGWWQYHIFCIWFDTICNTVWKWSVNSVHACVVTSITSISWGSFKTCIQDMIYCCRCHNWAHLLRCRQLPPIQQQLLGNYTPWNWTAIPMAYSNLLVLLS